MADKDPFAKYGGAALAPQNTAAADPFSKYGGAAIPSAVQPAVQPRWGSSAADVLSTVGQHAANAVIGPAKTILEPPQNAGERVANYAMPGGLAAYRTLVEPSIAPVQQAVRQVRAGDFSGAARSAESAIPVVGPWADRVENDVANKGAVAGLAGLATDVLAPQAVAKAVSVLPATAERAAPGIINKTIGARKGDFARGANPGRGYLDAKLGPSGSMEAIADKASDARAEVGQALGNAYSDADATGKLIPADTVRKAIGPIMDEAKAKAGAPGVVADPSAYQALSHSFEPSLQAADAKGGFTPSELWKIRKDMNESLNWGDQSKLNLTKTQQRVSGALGGLLEDAVPDAADLNQNYQDLSKLHARASERAATGSQSLGGMVAKGVASGVGGALGHATGLGPAAGLGGAALGAALESVPAKTALATGLSGAGKVLRPVATGASAAALPATLAAVAGDTVPQDPGDDHDDQGDDSAAQQPSQVSPNLTQGSPSTESIAPEPTPDTHTFSPIAWLNGNPDGDHQAATDEALRQGYMVSR